MRMSLTPWQTFCLLFIFQLGTTIVFGFAGGAKQDAWLAALISTLIGCGVVWCIAKVYEQHPKHNWVAILKLTFGSWVGHLLAMLYILALIYEAGRILRDLGELMTTFLLPRTPIGFSMFLVLVLVVYAANAGIERMARLAEVSIWFIFIFLLLLLALLLSSGVNNFGWLLPMATDWKHIAVTVFPLGLTTTFGETIVFAMMWTLTVGPKDFRRSALFSSLAVGLVFILLDLIAVGTLGPQMFSRALYPLLSTFQLIRVADFIDNLDPAVVSIFITGGMFKVFAYAYAACAGIAAQWHIRDHRAIVVPVGTMILLTAIYTAKSISSHIFVGLKWVPWVIELPLFVMLPIVVLAIGTVKKQLQSSQPGGKP
ncbi:spore germination protein KB [Paenibacillus methanolicus]|uniref:Spore germination protein KB n=1 Tax=Paenibacillus methanolicus TaxID=582686 RepID=A0A5S5BZC6_9BACL|nr:spore germination protein KB [Paenibacillus methanolicus]